MKTILTLLISILLLSCNKEDTPKQIEGDWYYTRAVVHYNDGSPYYTVDNSWDDAIYTNTDSKVYVANHSMSYNIVDDNSIYIIDLSKNADIEYLDSPRDGFDLNVIGNSDPTIEKLVYSYRRKK